jgi:hypothetical protein
VSDPVSAAVSISELGDALNCIALMWPRISGQAQLEHA